MVLKHLLDQGLSKAAIARQLEVSRGVIYHWIRTGQLDRDLGGEPRRRRGRATKLDPYLALVTTRLATYPALSAVRLFDEVRAAGYRGSITQLRDVVARIRPRPEPAPVARFETPPGQQAQVDFADCQFPWGRRFALLVVLGYSRLLWLRFYPRQTMAIVMEGLEHAFGAFGGVPQELLFDQMKAVITADRRPEGGKLLENAEFLRFAAHWGFRIRACRPYRAQTKGKVERPVGYVRSNLLYGRDFVGDADLGAQTDHWLEHTANVRVHGTTGAVPRERFEQEERAALQPLAAHPYRSVLLPSARALTVGPAPRGHPLLVVERRPLGAYTALAEATR